MAPASGSPANPPRAEEGQSLSMDRLELLAVPGLPLVEAGDDLVTLISEALARSAAEETGLELRSGDIVIAAQKIVSKAEGRSVDLRSVEVSPEAELLAREVDKDPRLVELVLSESRRVVRKKPGVLIVEHRLGLVLANAGIDRSNIDGANEERVLLLPIDPDRSAENLREGLERAVGVQVAVIVNDSLGRPWRIGTTGTAIGVSGLLPVRDLRGDKDLFGRTLEVSEQAFADELAAAASILQGQAAEATPVVIVRGYGDFGASAPATTIVRDPEQDLFR